MFVCEWSCDGRCENVNESIRRNRRGGGVCMYVYVCMCGACVWCMPSVVYMCVHVRVCGCVYVCEWSCEPFRRDRRGGGVCMYVCVASAAPAAGFLSSFFLSSFSVFLLFLRDFVVAVLVVVVDLLLLY